VILVDANLLDRQLSGFADVGLPSLLAFLRLLTNPRIFKRPEPTADAGRQVREWLACENTWIPQSTERDVEIVSEILALPGIRGNLIPDAISPPWRSSKGLLSAPY
jgi:predicted nucleic acid-binding protein